MDSVHLPVVVIGLLGTTLDVGKHPDRWQNWRPTVSICSQPDLVVSRFELLHGKNDRSLAERVRQDIAAVSSICIRSSSVIRGTLSGSMRHCSLSRAAIPLMPMRKTI
jgi:sigma54-dependent transcription regulator